MANTSFDFLTESFLFNDSFIERLFDGVSNEKLFNELQKYRRHCQTHKSDYFDEIRSVNTSDYGIFYDGSSQEEPSIWFLKQALLYFDTIVLLDPLFGATHEVEAKSAAMTERFFGTNVFDVERAGIAKICRFMKTCTSAIAAGILKFIPSEFIHPKETGADLLSPTYHKEGMSPEVEAWFRKKARVYSARKVGTGIIEDRHKPLKRCASISIVLDGDAELGNVFFHTPYSEEKVWHQNANLEKPATNAEFQAWVQQSIGRVAHRRFHEIAGEIRHASDLKLRYLTQSSFANELLRIKLKKKPFNTKTRIAESMFRLELPVLRMASLDDIIYVRNKCENAFARFRNGIEKRLCDVIDIDDENELNKKINAISYSISHIETSELVNSIANGLEVLTKNSTIVMAAAIPYYITNNNSDLFSLLIANLGLGAANYLVQNRASPGYFLWMLERSIRS